MNYEEFNKGCFEEAKRLYKTANADQRYVLESLFPELAESEDERIRKHLIDCVTRTIPEADAFKEISKEQILAWLEKQGEQKSIWHNEDEEPQRGRLILLIMQSGTPIVAKIIEPNHTFNHGERWAYIDDLLENQGTPYTKRDVDDAYLKGVCDAKQELEKQGEKKLANSAKTCKKSQRRITDNKRKLP